MQNRTRLFLGALIGILGCQDSGGPSRLGDDLAPAGGDVAPAGGDVRADLSAPSGDALAADTWDASALDRPRAELDPGLRDAPQERGTIDRGDRGEPDRLDLVDQSSEEAAADTDVMSELTDTTTDTTTDTDETGEVGSPLADCADERVTALSWFEAEPDGRMAGGVSFGQSHVIGAEESRWGSVGKISGPCFGEDLARTRREDGSGVRT